MRLYATVGSLDVGSNQQGSLSRVCHDTNTTHQGRKATRAHMGTHMGQREAT